MNKYDFSKEACGIVTSLTLIAGFFSWTHDSLDVNLTGIRDAKIEQTISAYKLLVRPGKCEKRAIKYIKTMQELSPKFNGAIVCDALFSKNNKEIEFSNGEIIRIQGKWFTTDTGNIRRLTPS